MESVVNRIIKAWHRNAYFISSKGECKCSAILLSDELHYDLNKELSGMRRIFSEEMGYQESALRVLLPGQAGPTKCYGVGEGFVGIKFGVGEEGIEDE